jgi:hypothetical protein
MIMVLLLAMRARHISKQLAVYCKPVQMTPQRTTVDVPALPQCPWLPVFCHVTLALKVPAKRVYLSPWNG